MGDIDRNAIDTDPGGRTAGRSATRWPRLITAAASERGLLFLAMLVVSGSVFALLSETFASMVAVWRNSSTFVHGFLVLPISAFLIWKRRGALRPEASRPSPVGFTCLALAVFLWLLSSEAYAQTGQHLAFVAIVVTALWAVIGTRNAQAILFPLLFAFFAVPFGEFLIPPLMTWTANFTVWALNATGIPVYLEAYVFALPSGTFEVIEACSGIRYLLVTLVLAIFFAHERFNSVSRRVLFVLGAAAAIIVANGIRAYLIVLIAHLSDMRFGAGQDHIYFGWLVFLVSLFVIFWIGGRFAEGQKSAGTPNPGDTEAAAAGRQGVNGRSGLFSVAGAIAIIALGPLGQEVVRSAPADETLTLTLPSAAAPWSGPGPASIAYRPLFAGEFQEAHGSYVRGGEIVDVHGIYFVRQRQGNELVSQRNRIYGPPWRLVRRLETRDISVQGTTMQVNSLVVTDGEQHVLLWYWYDIGGWRTTSDLATKLYHAVQGILGRGRGDAAVILATSASISGDGRDSVRLEEFLDGHMAALSACLRSSPGENANCADQR